MNVIQTIREQTAKNSAAMIDFLREICAIPSMNGQLQLVGERVAAEMEILGYDEVRFDRMGNILGRIGSGPRTILYDSHLDTVGVGDRDAWDWDPFQGKVEGGVLFARGACDEKGSTPGMVYGLAMARDLGLLEGTRAYYFGNMEEWCDGLASRALVEVEGVRPDFVVIGEPTRMKIYRGHKGRAELQVVAKGRSAHAASNELGDNAVYKMLPVIEGVRDLGPSLHRDPFLGQGRITVTDITCETASINAVPDACTIFIDRRLTFGESKEEAIAQVQALLPAGQADAFSLSMLQYEDASYTGFVFPVEKYFPAWALPEGHALVAAGQETCRRLWGEPAAPGKWNFSTNGTYWMGQAGIPSIGFGPGDEVHAHTVLDQVRLDDVVRSASWYALFPAVLGE